MSDQTDDLLRQADGYAKALYGEDQPLSEVLYRLAASLRASREQVAELHESRRVLCEEYETRSRELAESQATVARLTAEKQALVDGEVYKREVREFEYRWLLAAVPLSLDPEGYPTADEALAAYLASLGSSREQVAEADDYKRNNLRTQQRRWERLRAALGDDDRKLGMDLTIDAVIAKLAEAQATVARLTEENDRLRSLEALHAKQADAANGEVARLTAEKQALVEGKVWPIFKGDDHEDGLPPCAFRTIVDGRWTDFATPDEALTAERDDARAALARLAETVEQMPRVGFNSTRDSEGAYISRAAVLRAIQEATE